MRNAWAWSDKDERAKIADRHVRDMDDRFDAEIACSVRHTEVCSGYARVKSTRSFDTKIEVVDTDTVSAIFETGGNRSDELVAALNFASYKNPGGMFLQGSKAQEECLCHASTLYNVLREMPSYYDDNKKTLNRSLYTDRGLYSPDIVFEKDGRFVKCDVITVAAPNKAAAMTYAHVTEEQNETALMGRIHLVLRMAVEHNIDTLILGAFGCGVFGQNPKVVASWFRRFLTSEEFSGTFRRVVFAIPNGNNENFETFRKEWQKNV